MRIYRFGIAFINEVIFTFMNHYHFGHIIAFEKVNAINCLESGRDCRHFNNCGFIFFIIYTHFQSYPWVNITSRVVSLDCNLWLIAPIFKILMKLLSNFFRETDHHLVLEVKDV